MASAASQTPIPKPLMDQQSLRTFSGERRTLPQAPAEAPDSAWPPLLHAKGMEGLDVSHGEWFDVPKDLTQDHEVKLPASRRTTRTLLRSYRGDADYTRLLRVLRRFSNEKWNDC